MCASERQACSSSAVVWELDHGECVFGCSGSWIELPVHFDFSWGYHT